MNASADLVAELRTIVGPRHVMTSTRRTLRFRRGFRAQVGTAAAVVRPGTLVEMWRALQAAVGSGAAIIVQAANTGLTGGSTPDDRIDRPVVIVSTLRLRGVHIVHGGHQVICLPGETLHGLERALRPFGREPHSVIGSSCLGASVVGGICNNSGGALVRRGPAFTEFAIYAQLDDAGQLRLVNALGADLGDEPEEMLRRLEHGRFDVDPIAGAASDPDYHQHIRDVTASTPARYNADPRRLKGASGSAGRVAVFAVRLDTFAASIQETTFYLGTNNADELSAVRRALLDDTRTLPISAEYLHRAAFDIADRYGRDLFWAIRILGTDRLPALYAAKGWLDIFGTAIGLRDLSERTLQRIGEVLPDHLSPRLREWNARFEHQLIVKVDGADLPTTRALIADLFPSSTGDAFECTADEAARASLHRFVTAGAANRCVAVNRHTLLDIVALDVALPRNAGSWFGELPEDLSDVVTSVIRYGHFLCHVFHRDYLVARGGDAAAIKARLLADLDLQRAEYPAEHNVGRQYHAKPALRDFYRRLDPCNRFNPGIGLTSIAHRWLDDETTSGEAA